MVADACGANARVEKAVAMMSASRVLLCMVFSV